MIRLKPWMVAVWLSAVGAAAQDATRPAATQPAALSTVLRRLPDDAHLVLVVPNLKTATDGARGLARSIGVQKLDGLEPHAVLAWALGAQARFFDGDGPLVVAISAQQGEPVILGRRAGEEPTTTAPAEPVADARLFELGEGGSLALTTDGVVVLSRESADLRRALRSRGQVARELESRCGDLLARQHLVLYLDAPPWNDWLTQQLQVVAQSMYLGMATMPDAAEGIQLWKWMFEQAERLAGELQRVVGALRIDGAGLRAEVQIDFQEGGAAARYLAAVRKSDKDLLRGLPVGDAAVVFAYEWELASDVEGVEASLLRAVTRTESLREKMGDRLDEAVERSIAMQRRISGSSGMLAGSPEVAGFLFSGLYLTSQPVTVRRDLRTLYESCPELMSAWGGLPSFQLRPLTEEVAGVTADVYDFSMLSDDAEIQSALEAMYGRDPRLYLAEHSQGLAYALGPRDAARASLERLLVATSSAPSRDPRVDALFTTLSPGPQFCILVDAPRSLRWLRALVQRMGLPIFVAVPDTGTAPLAGFALYLDRTAVRAELLVPAEALRQVVAALGRPEATSRTDP